MHLPRYEYLLDGIYQGRRFFLRGGGDDRLVSGDSEARPIGLKPVNSEGGLGLLKVSRSQQIFRQS